MPIPAISIQNLNKTYRTRKSSFQALYGLDLTVNAGDFFGFLGPNGAGKTTTINILTGLANYDSGRAEVFGKDVMREYRQARRLVGVAPQEFNFDPYLNIEQILLYEAGYFGMSRVDAKRRAGELFEKFELTAKRKQSVRRLSGGMKRRLLIARALMHDPEILFLDEPTAGLDLELRYELWRFLKDLNTQGKTIFLTTHYLEEAERLCNRIGVVHQGKLAAVSSKEEMLDKVSGDWVFIRIRENISALPETLAATAMLFTGHNTIQFRESAFSLSDALNLVMAAGLHVEHVDVRKATLEDAFFKLTGMKKGVEV